MKPARFAYARADNRQEALALLDERGDDATLIAGGQSLVPLMALRLAHIDLLIDINPIGDLAYVRRDRDSLAVGALTRARDVERSPLVTELAPLLAEALTHVGHVQIRNRGTIGGSVAHADPAAEVPAVCVALDASIVITSARGERVVPAREFFVTHFTTVRTPDEMVSEIRIPIPPDRSGAAFLEVSRRRGDFALVGAAATVALDAEGRCTGAAAALAGVSDRPIAIVDPCAALIGERPTDRLAALVGVEASDGLDPSSDIHASARYRKRVAAVLLRRALLAAAARANNIT